MNKKLGMIKNGLSKLNTAMNDTRPKAIKLQTETAIIFSFLIRHGVLERAALDNLRIPAYPWFRYIA